MEDVIKASQITRTSMCNFLNMVDCIKETSQAFKIAHFWLNSLAHVAFNSPKAGKRTERGL